MRTIWKQFPVNWLTSGKLAFTVQRAKARRSQQMKKMVAQVEGLWLNSIVVLQRRTYHKSWLKLLHKRVLYKEYFLKDTARILVDRTFSCLTDILMFGTSHWTINNNSLKTRWIEAEYSRRGKYSKSHYSPRLICSPQTNHDIFLNLV